MFKKGQSGNPAGGKPGPRRPTFKTILESLPKSLKEFQHPDYGILNPYQLAVAMLVEAAGNGESWAIKELLDRQLGRPHQSVTVDGDMPMTVIWTNYGKNGHSTTTRIQPSSRSIKALPASE
jgi:hypothetical protein